MENVHARLVRHRRPYLIHLADRHGDADVRPFPEQVQSSDPRSVWVDSMDLYHDVRRATGAWRPSNAFGRPIADVQRPTRSRALQPPVNPVISLARTLATFESLGAEGRAAEGYGIRREPLIIVSQLEREVALEHENAVRGLLENLFG